MRGEQSPKSLTPSRTTREAAHEPEDDEDVWHHGTPDERRWDKGGPYGFHVGTYEAARQALEATIGAPAEGNWDGTREYGKTPIVSNEKNMGYHTGLSYRDKGQPRHENARYNDGTSVPLDARPSIFPVRITGPMANSPERPTDDEHANNEVRRRNAPYGYYYSNGGEDSGSVSAALPSAKHVERVHHPKTAAHEEQPCPACGSDLRDEWQHEGDHRMWKYENQWHTDWDEIHPKLPKQVRRGLSVKLPQDLHDQVHDNSVPVARRARLLFDHVTGGKGTGVFWSGSPETAKGYAEGNNITRPEDGATPVILHSRRPERGDIEEDEDTLRNWGVSRYDDLNDEHKEIPVREGAPVHLTGISWAPPDHHERAALASDPAWTHHRFSRGIATTASTRWQPSSGIFGPTTGLDPHLFDEAAMLRPQVREALMQRLDQCLRVDSGLAGSDWQEWMHVYLAGGSASEWAGSRPNDAAQDLDVIVAIDLAAAQGCSSFEGMSAGEAASALNAAFWKRFNTEGWQPEFGGTWNLTAFCNQRAVDITAIHPYAAYDVTGMRWAVKPPHLPEHSLADFSPALVAEARAVAAQARAILRLDEPMRTREARSLWERVHADRSRAFSDQGEGWQDAPNVIEKWLAYAPHGLLGKIRDLAMAKTAAQENPPCHYCGEPIDDEDVDEGHDAHDECQQMAWCEAHQDYHDNPVEAEQHNDTYTDWSSHLPFRNGIHRGINKQFPAEIHRMIHDESRPVAERGAFLRDHLNENPSEGMGLQRRLTDEEKYGGTGHFGVHWTDSEPHARGWAEDDMYEGPHGSGPKPSVTHVVLHAASPDREHVEEDPEELERRNMYGFDHDRSEREVPLKVGAPVHLTGISWKHGGKQEWNRHDFGEVTPKTAAWQPDTSGSDNHGVYLRFGDWPHDERSFSGAGGYHEEGVSAYDLDREGDPSIHWEGENGNDPQDEMQGRISKAERNRRYGEDKPGETGHLVRGEMSGTGYDGEPLLKNVRRVGDWIDHRHLFLDQAGPHRLARDPSDEDYEEPAEKPPYGYRNRTAAVMPTAAWRRPGQKFYHVSDSRNRESIARNGLDPRAGDEGDGNGGNWMWTAKEAAEEDEHDTGFSPGPGSDMWEVDPHHMQFHHGSDITGEWTKEDPVAVTFHHVHPARLNLVYDGRENRTTAPKPKTAAQNPDRYVTCEQGHEHWGALGAAGLLVRHRDGDSGPYRYLLQKRSPHVQHGGTWSTPGGALQHGEGPEAGALREASEEGMHLPPDLVHHHTFTDDHGSWAYHTVVMDSPRRFNPEGSGESDWESEGHRWVTPQEAQGLKLHPGFASSWDKVRKSGAVQKTAAYDPLNRAVQATAELGWGDDEWASARREPWHAAAKLAQKQVREDHPKLGMPFPRSHEGGDEMVGHILKHVGYQGSTDGAFVSRHPDPTRRTSNPAWLGGKPGVTLHPDRWDYGTVTHEAAHHAVMYDHAVAPGDEQPDEQVHGPEWAGHYAQGLSRLSKGAGDDFLEHHQFYRNLIHEGLQWKRPSDMDEADRRWRESGESYPNGPRPQRSHYGAASALPQPPQMPPRQQDAHDEPDFMEYRRKALDVARNPEPGTVIWRSEQRGVGEDPHPQSVGIHWTVKPEQVIHRGDQDGRHTVVYQGRLHDPGSQAIPRSHPMWGGRHRSMDSEAEVRLRPGASVHVEGTWVPSRPSHTPKPGGEPWEGGYRGNLNPLHPERMDPGNWEWHPVGHEVPVRHAGQGAADYSDVGIEREAARDGVNWDPERYWENARQLMRTEDVGRLHSQNLRENTDGVLGEHVPVTERFRHGSTVEDWDRLDRARGTAPRREENVTRHMREHGFDPDYPVEIGMAAGPGYSDVLYDGHNRYSSAKDLGISHIPVHISLSYTPESEWEDSGPAARKEAAAASGVPQRPKRAPGSAMVYLDVPHGTVEPYEGQEGGHHVALAYLPRSIGDEDFERVKDRAREAAARHAPMKATVGGGEVFPPGTPSDRRRVAVVPVHAPGIHELHGEFSEFDRAHYETYTPHVTRAQLGGHQVNPPSHPEASFPVTHVHVRRGDEVHSFPLTGPSHIEREATADSPWKFFHGTMDPRHIVPTDDIASNEHLDRGGQGREYQDSVRDDIAAHGMLTPIALDYDKRGRDRIPKPYILQGHHRHRAAIELGVGEVPVSASSRYGVPKGMKNAREISNAEMNAHVNGYAWGKDMRREAAADPQFFHGTDSKLSEGELIAPGRPKVNGGSDPRHVYFTEKYEHAEGAGRGAADRHRTSYDKKNGQWVRGETGPHYVYQVEPTGDWGQDEQLPWTPYSHQSAHPLRVVRDVTRRDGDMHHEAVSGYDGLTGRSGMIYLDLPPGTVRLVPGGVDDHHITLVYLGKNVSDKAFEEACRRTRAAAARLGPMDGVLRGIDVFPPSKGSDGKVVAFVPAYVGSVGLLRRELEDLSASEHTDWRPHVTLAYLEEGDGLPAPHPAVPLHFDRVHVKRGDEIRSYPLGGESNTASLDKVTAMSQPEFFHGTAHPFKPGDLVVPGIQVKKPGEQTYPHGTVDPEMHHVYVSTSEEEAACHAEASAEAHYNRHDEEDVPPRVFQVRPTGPLEVDPEDEGMQHPLSWRSRHPMKVIREVNRDGERSLW